MIAPQLKPLFQRGFAATARLLLRRDFAGVWLDVEGAHGFGSPLESSPDSGSALAPLPSGPVIFYSTHAAWHDPLVFAHLGVGRAQRRVLAPMDQKEFRRYRSLRWAGVFGVEPGDGPAVEAMLQNELAKHPSTSLWITPQGAFAPNELPQPAFRGGLERWAKRFSLPCVPVVVHYQLGNQSKPRVYVRVGAAQTNASSERLREVLDHEVTALLPRAQNASAHRDGPVAMGFREIS